MPDDHAAAIEEVHYGPRDPWLACVVPMLVFLAAGILEPAKSGAGLAGALGIGYGQFPLVYAGRVAVTLLCLARAWPALRGWLGRPSWWPPLVGLGLVVPWVVLATLQRDAGWFAGGSGRSAFDPFEQLGADSRLTWAYLLIRGLGLVVIVPIVEELFLRGFLMRFVIADRFWTVPFATLTAAAAGACALYAVGSPPSEAGAAIVWFAAVTGIALATRKPIDCITAHAATNLALGGYVLATGNWWLL